MDRTNEEWLSDLRSDGQERESAIADLTKTIISSLPYALSKWLRPGDPRLSSLIEETAQETVLRVLAKLDTFEGRSKFTTWVYTIAVRIALTELRRAKWKETSLDEMIEGKDVDDSPLDVASNEPGIAISVEKKELMEMVQEMMMNQLTERQRKALTAIVVQGVPFEEVAQRMGTNRNALYKLLHDARVKLKDHLEQNGMSVSEILHTFEN